MKHITDLDGLDLQPNPGDSFQLWFKAAQNGGQLEPEAMSLGTCDAQGRPSVRIVLLKGFKDGKFFFFTNYKSRKARELIDNPWAALTFHWRQPFHRQVRAFGQVKKASDEESNLYFESRPYQSRVSAWASPQSQVVADRDFLEREHKKFEDRFSNEPIYRPEFWGGFEVSPESFEFWQERPFRYHDRISYTKNGNDWQWVRLGP